MPFRRPRPLIVPAIVVALAAALVGGTAAVAQRAGVLRIPFTDASNRATAEESPEPDASEPDDADGAISGTPAPSEPVSGVTSSSTGDSPPTIDAVIEGTMGGHGWYTSDVTLTWTVEDPETPDVIAEGCDDTTVTEDTSGQTFTCTASSDGGSTTTVVTIARDTTAPAEVTVDVTPSATDGWHTAPFVATWAASDTHSGVAECTRAEYAGPDASRRSLTGSCVDHAGNRSADMAYEFSYDATAPAVTAVPDRGPDHDGWYNRAVTVIWQSDDEGASCDPATVYRHGDGDAITLRGGCSDAAGNRGEATFEMRYDATAPVVTIASPSAASYVLRQPVTVSVACHDATAGIASCESSQRSGAALDTGSVGSKSVEATAVDRAGNRAVVSHHYTVVYSPVGVKCGGVAGRQILEPVKTDGSSTFNGNSTVPAKFRVCDFYGTAVTATGVVDRFRIVGVDGAPADAPVPSTNAHEQYRAGDGQWIYNIKLKSLRAGSRYAFRISLDDGTALTFAFTIR